MREKDETGPEKTPCYNQINEEKIFSNQNQLYLAIGPVAYRLSYLPHHIVQSPEEMPIFTAPGIHNRGPAKTIAGPNRYGLHTGKSRLVSVHLLLAAVCKGLWPLYRPISSRKGKTESFPFDKTINFRRCKERPEPFMVVAQ